MLQPSTNAPTRSIWTLCSLVAADLFMLVGVFFFDWSILNILIVFLIDTVVICFINVAKVPSCTVRGADGMTKPEAIRGLIIFAGFLAGAFYISVRPGAEIEHFTRDMVIMMAVAAAWGFANHLWLLYRDFFKGGQYKTCVIDGLALEPMLRFVAFGAIIVLNGYAEKALGNPMWALAALVILKTVFDFVIYWFYSKSAVDVLDSSRWT